MASYSVSQMDQSLVIYLVHRLDFEMDYLLESYLERMMVLHSDCGCIIRLVVAMVSNLDVPIDLMTAWHLD